MSDMQPVNRRSQPRSEAIKAKISATLKQRFTDPAERARMANTGQDRRRKRAQCEARAFHIAATKLGFDPVKMVAVHADLASLAAVHELSMSDLRRIAGSRTLLTARPRDGGQDYMPLPKVVKREPQPVAPPTERPCLCCGRRIAYERNIRMCTECKSRA